MCEKRQKNEESVKKICLFLKNKKRGMKTIVFFEKRGKCEK